MRQSNALNLASNTIEALIPYGTPQCLSGAKSPWNLRSIIRYLYVHHPYTRLVDFSNANTGDRWMPSRDTLRRWSGEDDSWYEERKRYQEYLGVDQSELIPAQQRPTETGLYAHALSGKVKEDYLALYQHEDLMSLKFDLSVVAVKIQILMQQVSAAVEQGQQNVTVRIAKSPGGSGLIMRSVKCVHVEMRKE